MRTCNIAELQDFRYTVSMNEANAALGIYLKLMREGRRLKPSQALAQLSDRLGKKISWSRLSRTEKGEFKKWPDGDFLTALYDIVQADIADVAWIQRTPEAKPADGERLARDRNKEIEQRAQAIADQAREGAKTPATLVFVRQMLADPEALRELAQAIKASDAAQQP